MDLTELPEELRLEILQYGAPEINVDQQYLLEEIYQQDPSFDLDELADIIEAQQEELEEYKDTQEWQVYKFIEKYPFFSTDFEVDVRGDMDFSFDLVDPTLTDENIKVIEPELIQAFATTAKDVGIIEPNEYSKYYHGYIGGYDINTNIVRRIQFLHLPILERVAKEFRTYKNIKWD